MKSLSSTVPFCWPRFWLGLQLLAVIVALGALGLWQPQWSADTDSYVATSTMPLRDALCSTRTLGLPVLLRLASAIAPDYRAMPAINLALWCAAAFLVDLSARRFGASPWQALAFSSGFVYATIQWPLTPAALLSDFPAAVMAGTAAAAVFWVAGRPKSFAAWGVLTVTLAAAYQIRPAYLFLLILVPVLGALLYVAPKTSHSTATGVANENTGHRPRLRFGLLSARLPTWFLPAVLAATFLPLAAYYTFRWAMVGEFGLVSFGGDTSCGLAAELLTWPMIENELPADVKPLAAAVLRKREERGDVPAFRGRHIDLARYEHNFSPNIYLVTYPEARKIYGTNQQALNRALGHYSRAVLGLRKREYFLWAAYMVPRTAAKVVFRYWILWLLVPLALLRLVWNQRSRFLSPRKVRTPSEAESAKCQSASPSFLAWTCVLAALFYCGQVAVLVAAASYADSRLVAPAGLFLPSLLLLFILRKPRLVAEATSP